MLGGGVGLAFGGYFFAEHKCYCCQVDFGSTCREAPALVDEFKVRHYAGTVVGHPSNDGYWGDNDGPNRTLGAVVFVQIEDRERSLSAAAPRRIAPGRRAACRSSACGATDPQSYLTGHHQPLYPCSDRAVRRDLSGCVTVAEIRRSTWLGSARRSVPKACSAPASSSCARPDPPCPPVRWLRQGRDCSQLRLSQSFPH